MDAKILEAFNDLTKALDKVAEAVKDKTGAKSDAGKLIQKINNLDKKIDAINKGIQDIKKDTTQILKNQETLIRLSKEKKNPSTFETASDKKSKIKDGVNTVLLIASGVLAIGLAFKLIGQVNFLSVIALSIALPLIAKSFELIADMKIKKEDMKDIFFVIVTMASSITVASWIMSAIVPISIAQSLTAILISGTFALMGFSIEKITKGVKDVNLVDLIKIPIVMLVMGLSIAGASVVMQAIIPLSFRKGFTAIFIAATFAIIGYSIGTIAKNLKNIKSEDIIKIPLILIPFSIAMVGASIALQFIVPLSLKKSIAAVEIALVLTAMSLPLIVLSYAVRNTNIKDVALMTLIIPLLAGAIWTSSWILTKVANIDKGLLFNIVLQSIALAVMTVALGFGIWALKSMGVGPEEAFLGGLAVVIIAGAMAGASHLIAMGNYTNQPPIDWAIGTGLSILAFGLNMILIGAAMTSGIGAGALLLGVVGVILISGAILGVAKIFEEADFKNYPSLDWAQGVGLSITAFGLNMLMLGGFIVGSFGAGLGILAAGAIGMVVIADSIVEVSKKLKDGNYKDGPTEKWAEGVGLAISAFAPVIQNLNKGGILGLFKGGLNIKDFTGDNGIIVGISNAIVKAAEFFNENKVTFKGSYPSSDWSAGVGAAIGAFAPVFDVLKERSGFFNKITPEEIENMFYGIGKALVSTAQLLGDPKLGDIWKGGPKSDWSDSISKAISAFQPALDAMVNAKDISTDTLERMPKAIGRGIVDLAESLSGGNFTTIIPSNFVESISGNIKSYVDIIKYLKDNGYDDDFNFGSLLGISSGIARLADDYNLLAKGVKNLNSELNKINIEKLNALNMMSGSIVLMSLMDSDQFEKMMDALEEKAGIFVKTINMLQEGGETTASKTLNVPTKGGKNNEILEVLNNIKTNTDNLATLNQIPAAIRSLKTGLDNLISELKHDTMSRKTHGR
jgi:hypothetical protein